MSGGANVGRDNVIYATAPPPPGVKSVIREWRNAMVHHDIKVTSETVEPVTPPFATPNITVVVGTHPDQDHVLSPRPATIRVEAPPARLLVTPRRPVLPWLESAAVFIPKTVREPFFGDLHEDLAAMTAEGRSATAIRWAAASQVVWLLLRWVWLSGLFRR